MQHNPPAQRRWGAALRARRVEALARHSLDGPPLKYGSSIKINIVQRTEAELIDLNYPIVGHLRFLDQM